MKDQYITILEKLDHKKTNISYSQDRTRGIEDAIEEISKETKIEKCRDCKRWFKGLNKHKNIHLKFK